MPSGSLIPLSTSMDTSVVPLGDHIRTPTSMAFPPAKYPVKFEHIRGVYEMSIGQAYVANNHLLTPRGESERRNLTKPNNTVTKKNEAGLTHRYLEGDAMRRAKHVRERECKDAANDEFSNIGSA